MKNLYRLIVVTTKEEIILEKLIVAEDENEARFLADISHILKVKDLKPKDVTIICLLVGQVKVEKEPQKVEIVERKDK